MGNNTSFPCCHAPGTKDEITRGEAATGVVKVPHADVSAADVAPLGADGNAEAKLLAGKTEKEPRQQAPGVAFNTSNPMEVAPELAPQQGLPYQFHVCGPPPPPCDDMRLRTINALKTAGSVRMDADAIDAPPDPEIASILKLVQSIFEAPAALVALFDDRRIFIRDAEGAFQRGDFPWRWSFCGWTMASQNDQIMVIPDATKDARFCNNAMVKSGPGVRFYCGTPLIASNGHRIGTLCFADVKPREFDASRCVVLNNLAELVVRHLEKDIALQLRAHDNNTLAAAYGNLRRTLDCFDHCVALLDTSTAGWRILFVNNPCCKALGIERESLLGSYLSRLLSEPNGSMLPSDDNQRAADRGQEFQVLARLSKAVVEEMDEKNKDAPAIKSMAEGQRFMLTFRPASREDLDGGQIPIGVPNWIPASPKAIAEAPSVSSKEGASQGDRTAQRRTDTLYFMLLQDAVKLEAERKAQQAKAAAEAKAAAAAGGSVTSSGAHSSHLSIGYSHDKELSQPPESISGLSMGHLLGKGAYGSVYYGTWYGSPVAVKIIDEELPPGAESIAPPIEAILSKELRHPHVVATLRCARRIIGPAGSSYPISGSTSTTAVVANIRRNGPAAGGGGGGAASGAAVPRLGVDGSAETFTDDTARVSGMTVSSPNECSGAAGSTSGNAPCFTPRRGGPSGDSTLAPNGGSPDCVWQVNLPKHNAATGTGATVTNSAASDGATMSVMAANGSSVPGISTPSIADASACNTSFAMSNAASPLPGGATTVSPGGGGSEISAAATGVSTGLPDQSGAYQASWAIINLEAGGAGAQVPRRRSSTTAPQAEVAAAAGAAVEGEGSTDNSEAYDDFDAGRDSSMSPFLLPPGSHQQGPAGGGASGAGGNSGLKYSGHSGRSERWAAEDVLVRHQTWLIMEYCDKGCLQDAIDRGWLRTSPSLDSSGPRMDAVLATAVELASALAFLHSKDIVHGDMSAWNVMLCTSGATASQGGRGFVAKIADFGLARHLDIRTKIQTRTYGTLTHMPAETLRDGVISKATDVYSLGVLLWQLFTSSRPWAGLRHGQIIVMVVTQGARLRFPPGCPAVYEDLAMACMEPDPRNRPSIEAVLAELDSIRKGCL